VAVRLIMASSLPSEMPEPQLNWSVCAELHNRLLSIAWAACGQPEDSETDTTWWDEHFGSLGWYYAILYNAVTDED
jgi:hypothetical protein